MESSKAKQRGVVEIRQVWAANLTAEFNHINSFLEQDFRYASFDTEFPGTLYPQVDLHCSPAYVYAFLKFNVDNTNLIQLGLTLCNSKGELPELDGSPILWEFNFSDFDLSRGDSHNSASIELLKRQGINFEINARYGIHSRNFARYFLKSGLFNPNSKNPVTWIGFHTGYDFGYFVKLLTQTQLAPLPLPEQLGDFLNLVNYCFGTRIYDVKHIMKFCSGLYGGLDKVAKLLGVKRRAGRSHQAGSDSLLTMETFLMMKEYFLGYMWSENQMHNAYGGVLFGLEVVHDAYGGVPFGLEMVPQFGDWREFYKQNAPEALAPIYMVA